MSDRRPSNNQRPHVKSLNNDEYWKEHENKSKQPYYDDWDDDGE